jgi:uncharacterized protein (TIRG00374 family)
MATGRDAILVTEATGRTFHSLEPGAVGDEFLLASWQALAKLHGLGVAHGQLDGYRLVERPDGSPALGDFGEAKVAALDPAMMADRARLLVTTALSVGHERAVEAATAAMGSGALVDMLPYLQPAVLDRATRQEVDDKQWDLDDLRTLAAQKAGTEPPKLEQLRRVSWKSVLVVALVAFLAYTLIATIANVGLQSLIDELRAADAVWLWAALLLSPVVQVGQAFSTMGASIQPMRFGPVLMLEYAIQFIQLAVPSSAARIALEVRFFEKNGVESGGAIAIGAIDSVCGFVIQILLILVITLSGLASIDFSLGGSSSSSSSDSSGPSLLALVAVLLVLGLIVALIIPKYRAMIRQAVPRTRAAIRDQVSASAAAFRVFRSPSHIGLIFGGNLFAQLLQAVILGLCLHAFGYSATLAELVLVNTFVSLFAGFMPVPGGMGVAEAGYTAGLSALGVPNTAAMSTAIAFRLVTFYLPPIWGSYATRWLRRHSYL